MTTWCLLNGYPLEGLGFLPDILMSEDKRPVKEQLEDRYRHGGGWRPFGDKKFKLNPKTLVLTYPGDPPFKPCATTQIGDEKVVFYAQCSLLAVIQPDGKWEVTRVD